MLSASSRNLFKGHEEVLYLQPLIPPKRFDIFSPITSLSLLLFVFFGCSDGMEREACVCDHGYERSDLCAEIIIIIIIIITGGCSEDLGVL